MYSSILEGGSIQGYDFFSVIISSEMSDKNILTKDWHRKWYDAISENDIDQIRRLISSKADVDTEGTFEKNETALIFITYRRSSSGNCSEIVDLLLRSKANVNAKCGFGWSPLHCASRNGNVRVIEQLIEAKADMNSVADRDNNLTPLDLSGATETAKLLIRHGAYRCRPFSWMSKIAIDMDRDWTMCLKSSLPLPIDGGHHLLHLEIVGNLWKSFQ